MENLGGPRKFTKPQTEILPLTDAARNYLINTRRLRPDTLEAYRLGSNKHGEIVIPFYNEIGELELVKFRHARGERLKRRRKTGNGETEDYEAKSVIEPGGKPILLGSHLCAPEEGALVICFGDYDAMSVAQDGIPNCVSLPFGDKGFGFIEYQWNFLEKFEEIILYPDADEFDRPDAALRAQKKLDELATRLGKYRCRIVRRQDRHGSKDANELLLKKGPGANRKVIENAEWFPTGIVAVADYEEPEMIEGVPIGLADVDKATGGFGGGHLIVVSGDNGAGKTTKVFNIVAHFIENEVPAFFWSGEQKVGKIRYWFERIVAGPDNLKRVLSEKTKFEYYFPLDDVREAMRRWYRNFLFQYTEIGIDPETFFEAAELGVRRYGCRLIVIDNLMAFTGGEGEGYYQAQGDFAESCKRFAEKWNVSVILICHNKKFEQTGKKPRLPNKDDIEGSKKITNWADFVIQIYRVPETFKGSFGNADSIFILCKNRETGIFEDVRLAFDYDSLRLCQLTERNKLKREFGWTRWLDNPREPNPVDDAEDDPRFK